MPTPQVAVTDDDPQADKRREFLEEQASQRLDDLDEATAAAADEAAAEDESEDEEIVVEEQLADPVFGDDFFDGTEDFDDGDDTGGRRSADEAAEKMGAAFEEQINEGFARLAVVGLDESDGKDELREEFEEVFESFRLGHYGNECLHEYVLTGEEEIDPIWGFVGALLLCMGLVIYMRPDGDRIIDNAKDRVHTVGNSLGVI